MQYGLLTKRNGGYRKVSLTITIHTTLPSWKPNVLRFRYVVRSVSISQQLPCPRLQHIITLYATQSQDYSTHMPANTYNAITHMLANTYNAITHMPANTCNAITHD